MFIPRTQLNKLTDLATPGKAVVIYGPRRCGKTTLIERFIEARQSSGEKVVRKSGDELDDQIQLSAQSSEKFRSLIGGAKTLVIDEAQQIPNIGLNLKIIVDNLHDVSVVATGSSSFELANHLSEPLTGRASYLRLYPPAQLELKQIEDASQTRARLETRLLHGSYPEVVTANSDATREDYLRNLCEAYLYRDILAAEGIRRPDRLKALVRLLAFQVGSEVSLAELARQLDMSKNTVAQYVYLLEKAFVLYRLGGYSGNLRNEVTKMPKYYFWDVGVRNAVIGDFRPLASRQDVGRLWENYLVIERAKRREYVGPFANDYFWRTRGQQEIDLVEEYNGQLRGYEFKWGDKPATAPSAWTRAYPDATFEVVNRENYLNFIGA